MKKVGLVIVGLLLLSSLFIALPSTIPYPANAEVTGNVFIYADYGGPFSKVLAYTYAEGLNVTLVPDLVAALRSNLYVGGYISTETLDEEQLFEIHNFVQKGGRIFAVQAYIPTSYPEEVVKLYKEYFGLTVATESGYIKSNFWNASMLFPSWRNLTVVNLGWVDQFFVTAGGNIVYQGIVKSDATGLDRVISVGVSDGKGVLYLTTAFETMGGNLYGTTNVIEDTRIDSFENRQAADILFRWLSAGGISTPENTTQPSQSQTTTNPNQIIVGISNDTLILAIAIVIAGIAVGVGISRRRGGSGTKQKTSST